MKVRTKIELSQKDRMLCDPQVSPEWFKNQTRVALTPLRTNLGIKL